MLEIKELRRGATGIIFKVNSLIVMKSPSKEGREDFIKENHIFDILSQNPCPEVVISFLRFDNANFLEYAPGFSLSERLQRQMVRNPNSRKVLSTSLEPLPLRKTWMKALAEAAAWLESLGYAHGDLKPENILVGKDDRIKLANFDCTNLIGSEFEACIPPYGRLLGSEAGSERGTAGSLGARTEQFALGSVFYYINYGLEVYDDQDFGQEHGPIIVDRLQHMMFPTLDKDPVLDSIISDCWHNRYQSISALSKCITERCDLKGYSAPGMPAEEFATRQAYCRELVKAGILQILPKAT